MSKSHFQCGLSRFFGRDRIGYQRAKPDGGDGARSMGKRNPRIAKRIGGAMLMPPLSEASCKSQFIANTHCPTYSGERRNTISELESSMNQVQVEQKSYQMPPQDGFTVAYFLTVASAIPSFFVAANLQPQIRILISRYSSCESCGTGFCVTIIADEGVSFQKSRFRSLDLTLKGQKVPKSGHF